MGKWDTAQDSREIGVALVKGSFISDSDLASAEDLAVKSNKKLSEILVEQGMIDSEVLGSVLSLKYGVPVVNLAQMDVQSEATALVSEQVAREHHILPISLDGDTLTIATNEPHDFRMINSIGALTRKKIETVIPVGMGLEEAIDSNYTLRERIEEQVSQIAGLNGDLDAAIAGSGDADILKQAPIVQAVDMMLTQAVRDRASELSLRRTAFWSATGSMVCCMTRCGSPWGCTQQS